MSCQRQWCTYSKGISFFFYSTLFSYLGIQNFLQSFTLITLKLIILVTKAIPFLFFSWSKFCYICLVTLLGTVPIYFYNGMILFLVYVHLLLDHLHHTYRYIHARAGYTTIILCLHDAKEVKKK